MFPFYRLDWLKMFTLLILSLVSVGLAVPTGEILPRQTKPYQSKRPIYLYKGSSTIYIRWLCLGTVRGVQAPIYHLYLQSLPSNKSIPVMGPEATGEFFTIGSTIKSQNSTMFLNIGTGSSSYLPLNFATTATTTAWGLEGDTIITANGSKYGRRENIFNWMMSLSNWHRT